MGRGDGRCDIDSRAHLSAAEFEARVLPAVLRGVDAPASRCFSWPVRSAPSVASTADTTLGCYSNSAFFFAVDPQVSSLSHSRKRESLRRDTNAQSVQEGAA